MSGGYHVMAEPGSDHADEGWDGYAERVLRNEGRLGGLETLVAETRDSDNKLIGQRSESLAQELVRSREGVLELVTARADAVKALGMEERTSDRRYHELLADQTEKSQARFEKLLREIYDSAIRESGERNAVAITALEQRRGAATDRLEQMVRQWRDSDEAARVLFAAGLAHHLDTLNHNNERMRAFQVASVTRELWQSEKDASLAREDLLRQQIIALDRVMLTMTPIAIADKTHVDMLARMETSIASAVQVLDNRISAEAEKVAELKTYRDTTSGRSSGYNAVYGWAIAGVTVLIAVIILADSFIRR